MKLFLVAYTLMIAFWQLQHLVAPDPSDVAFKLVLLLHALLCIAIAATAWGGEAKPAVTAGLLLISVWPVTAPYGTTLLLFHMLGTQSKRADLRPEHQDLLAQESRQWLRKGQFGIALLVAAAYVVLLPHWAGMTEQGFPYLLDPLRRGPHSPAAPARVALLTLSLFYCLWLWRTAGCLTETWTRRAPPQ